MNYGERDLPTYIAVSDDVWWFDSTDNTLANEYRTSGRNNSSSDRRAVTIWMYSYKGERWVFRSKKENEIKRRREVGGDQ